MVFFATSTYIMAHWLVKVDFSKYNWCLHDRHVQLRRCILIDKLLVCVCIALCIIYNIYCKRTVGNTDETMFYRNLNRKQQWLIMSHVPMCWTPFSANVVCLNYNKLATPALWLNALHVVPFGWNVVVTDILCSQDFFLFPFLAFEEDANYIQ